MNQKSLSKWLKVILIGIALSGLMLYGWILPVIADAIAYYFPEWAHCYTPWMILMWITGIPCYIVLFLCWKVAVNIGRDRTFSFENGKLFRLIGKVAVGDSILFFAANVVFLFLNLNHPFILIGSCVVVFLGTAIAVASKVMAQLVDNAASMKEENDLTI